MSSTTKGRGRPLTTGGHIDSAALNVDHPRTAQEVTR